LTLPAVSSRSTDQVVINSVTQCAYKPANISGVEDLALSQEVIPRKQLTTENCGTN